MQNYTIVQINRNQEVTCVCGSICEKISFEVADQLGNVETYGSSCVESVLGIDAKRYELKRGVQTLKLEVVKSFPENNAFQAIHKKLELVSNSDINNNVYKVVGKWVVADLFTGLEELSNDQKTINYNYKANKATFERDQKVQMLEVGQRVQEKELTQ
jgi:hypothetical protein